MGSLKGAAWFPAVDRPRRDGGIRSAIAKLAVSALVGAGMLALDRPVIACAVWGIGGGVGVVSLASARARRAVDAALARVGHAIGAAISTVLLTLVYLLVVTPVRLARRALGADDLHLRDRGSPSYWLPCDDEARKARWVGSMFATEAPRAGGRPARAAIAGLVALLGIAEVVLRAYGFGHTVLYVADPDVGYTPQPNVTLSRYGGTVSTNQFGMRSPRVAQRKPDGAFRILMLGDSTLYGGSYIDQEDLYASRLRVALARRGGPGAVEVLAMGVNGWGPFHERAFVRKAGTFDADLVMIHLPIDDVNRPLYGLMSVPFFAVNAPPRLALEEVANHLMWRYRSAHAGLDARWEERQALYGVEEYGRLVEDVKRSGAEVMVFVLPEREPGFGGDEAPRHRIWRERLEAVVTERGARAYFAKGLFAGKGKPAEIYHDGVHLDAKGHAVYAGFIEGKVAAESRRFLAWSEGSAP